MTPKRSTTRATRRDAHASWIPLAEWGAAILLTLLALIGHTSFFAHAGALWRDEVNTADFAAMPSIAAIHDSLQYDSFPMAATLALRAWMALGGGSDAGLRAYGLIVGILFLGALWVSARLLGRRTPILSLALVALNPWVIYGADSIRPYGLGMVFIALTVGATWKWVASSSTRWLVAASALAILSAQCLYQNAFLLAAICLAAAIAAPRESRLKTILGVGGIGVAAALSLLIYLPSIAKAREWSVLLLTRPGWAELIRHVPDTTGAGGAIQNWAWLAVLALCAILAVRSLTVRSRAQTPAPDPSRFGASLVLIGTMVYLVAIRSAGVVTQPWYYAPLLAALAPALDAIAGDERTVRPARIAVLATAFLAAVVSAPSLLQQMNESRTNIDRVAAYVRESASPGDAIVVYPFYLGITFQRYYNGPVPWTTIPPLREVRIHRYDRFKEAMASPDPTGPVLALMGRGLQSGHRIWIVGGLQTPRTDRPPPSIAPAPHPVSGWAWAPYDSTWGEQAAYFLASHATQFDTAPDLGSARTSPYERVKLLVVSGWRP